jgi:histidyl-tRNA synthetase
VWNQVEAVAREVFRTYNYHEIRTPILEETQLFARGVGADTDIVTKEMYTFTDRDETSLTLRPENTASVIRAYIEHRLDQRPGVQKLYYMGPMFRRERPQKGRYRQFFQIGAEAIGSESPVVDAEVIEMVMEVLERAGLGGAKLLINSVGDHNCRPQYVEKLPAARGNQPAAGTGLQGGSGPADYREAAEHHRPPVRRVPRAFQSGEAISGRPRHRV